MGPRVRDETVDKRLHTRVEWINKCMTRADHEAMRWLDRALDYLAVTWCAPEQQIERLTAPGRGRGLTVEQARQRIAAQMPIDEKRERADEVIDCSGTLEHTRAQVIALFARLKRMEAERSREPSGRT